MANPVSPVVSSHIRVQSLPLECPGHGEFSLINSLAVWVLAGGKEGSRNIVSQENTLSRHAPPHLKRGVCERCLLSLLTRILVLQGQNGDPDPF